MISGLGSATRPVVGKYSTATHQPRGPRRQTWCRRSGQPATNCRDTQSPPGCHPPGGAWGCRPCSVSSPQAASRPCQPATSPPCWAGLIRTCSTARSPHDWWINLGTALPCPRPLPGSLGMVPEKPLHPWVLGRSPRPQPQNACTHFWALEEKNHEYVPGAGSC